MATVTSALLYNSMDRPWQRKAVQTKEVIIKLYLVQIHWELNDKACNPDKILGFVGQGLAWLTGQGATIRIVAPCSFDKIRLRV